jgi:hypothetical protein
MESLKLILDLVVIALLGTGIVFAIRLERQFRRLRATSAEMATYISDFARNVDRAEVGVKGLKQAARSVGDDLEQLLERGSGLRDELRFVAEHADGLVSKIADAGSELAAKQRLVSAAHSQVPTKLRPLGTDESETPAAEPRTRAERELLEALHQMQEKKA